MGHGPVSGGAGATEEEERRPDEDSPAPGSWQTFLVDGARGRALEAELLSVAGAEGAGASGQEPEDPGRSSVSQVYYDSAEWNLSKRGWWLLESQGAWTLNVPQFASDGAGGHKLQGYQQVLEEAEILDKMGLTNHAALLREGAGPITMSVLLSQASVVPFAQLLVEHIACRARCGPGGLLPVDGGDDGAHACNLSASLSHLRLDAQRAEHGAVADLLFSRGRGARDALQVSIVQFRPESGEDLTRRAVESCAEAHRLGQPFQTGCVPPHLAAYMRVLRPEHLAALRAAGVA